MPNDPQHLMNLLSQTEIGEQLADIHQSRELLFDLLADHPDPMWREMGSQLKGGSMQMIDIITTPAYREKLEEGLELARERGEELFADIEGAAEESIRRTQEEQSQTPEQQDEENAHRVHAESSHWEEELFHEDDDDEDNPFAVRSHD